MNEIIKAEKAEIILSKAHFTDNKMGLIFEENISNNEFMEIGKVLKMMEGRIQFFIGDFINAYFKAYEHGKYKDLEELGYEKKSLKEFNYVSGKIESSIRIDKLRWEHHHIVAPLEPSEQEYWLNKAVENSWTVRELREAIRKSKEVEPIPVDGKYKIIYADPPWKYGDDLVENYGAVEHHYSSLTIDELKNLYLNKKKEIQVKDVLMDNAVLFIWVTSPILPECFEVIEAWGFEYKASFVWDKVKELIDKMYPYREDDKVDRLELFARKIIDNWDAWGNELEEISNENTRD